jgi:hypothetical protein
MHLIKSGQVELRSPTQPVAMEPIHAFA